MQKHIDGIKITTFVIFILVTAAIFLALGYWAGSEGTVCNVSSIVSSKTATTTATASVSPTTSTTADATANWKTYTNEKYGFNFKYPRDFTATDDLEKNTTSAPARKLSLTNGKANMDVYVNPDGFGPFFPDTTYTIVSTDGKMSWTKTNSADENSKDSRTLAIGNLTVNSNKYLIFYSVNGSDTESLTQFDQILSTFQFTK